MRSGESMAFSIICSPSRPRDGGRPTRFLTDAHSSARVGPRLASPRAADSACAKLSFSCGDEEAGDRQLSPARHQKQPLHAEFVVRLAVELRPERIERPFGDLAAVADLADAQLATASP